MEGPSQTKAFDSLENQMRAEASLNPSILSRAPLTGLLRLPYEIRLRIYHYCIPRKRTIEVYSPHFYIPYWEGADQHVDPQNFENEMSSEYEYNTVEDLNLGCVGDSIEGSKQYIHDDRYYSDHFKRNNSIFLLCKQISDEALDVLYGDNSFKLSLTWVAESSLKDNFTQANRRRMRCLIIIAQPQGVPCLEDKPDEALWSSFLPSLNLLRIIAEQPIEARVYSNAPTLEEEISNWIGFITPFLRCFGQNLLRETIVEVDDDGRIETKKIFEQCLPYGYREVRCRSGDFIFNRGGSSWEPGYWDEDDMGMGGWDA
ncbi:hypothetical protein BGZ60DRAFT_432149 [Tricladium varicosporioides]|nr:hypothetical protein BGZ60DRAFT_432149 [Hymenoscyphus varicosporioides]